MPKLKKDDDGRERRTIGTPVKVTRNDDGTIGSIYGYPIVYNKWSEDLGGFIERILPGAATKALKGSDVRGLKNHDASLIFAREGINLKIIEDKTGVRYEATPVDTHNFREIAKEVDLGLLTGQSFGFRVNGDHWNDLDKDIAKRDISELEIEREKRRKESQIYVIEMLSLHGKWNRKNAIAQLLLMLVMITAVFIQIFSGVHWCITESLSVTALCMVIITYKDYRRRKKETDDKYTIEALKY